MKRLLLSLVALYFLTVGAQAATCFWVGGAGTWSTSNTASWASSTGGTTGTCAATGGVPKQSADTATFDGASGGGTVGVDSSMNGVTLTTLTTSAFTGTLDFSVGNPSMTLTNLWTDGATGIHTITGGSGTIIMSLNNGTPFNWTASANLTLTPGTLNLTFAAVSAASNTRTWSTASKSFGTVTFNGTNANGQPIALTGSSTIANLVLSNGAYVLLPASSTTTITNAFTLTGSSSTPFLLSGGGGTTPIMVLSAAGSTITWAMINHITFNTNSLTATNSFDGGGNTNAFITPPSGGGGGGGGHIIGG